MDSKSIIIKGRIAVELLRRGFMKEKVEDYLQYNLKDFTVEKLEAELQKQRRLS